MLNHAIAHFKAVTPADKPAVNVPIILRWTDLSKQTHEVVVPTDKDGQAIFAVPSQQLPQQPVEAFYETSGLRGRIMVGGLLSIQVRTLIVQAA